MTDRPTIPPADAETLQNLAGGIMDAFAAAGYRQVDPPVLQPAEIFLDLLGEDIRQRTYIFTDPADNEVCLRPDITIPTCRLLLAEHGPSPAPAKLSYYGRAFRHQTSGSGRPNEILQTGAESFGTDDTEAEDANIVALATKTCETQGLRDYNLRFGDVGLFFDFIDALKISERWRARLRRYIWQPDETDQLLGALAQNGQSSERSDGPGAGLLKALSKLNEEEARAALSDVLQLSDITPVGGRTLNEIADRLLAQAADSREDTLPREVADLINAYTAIKGDCTSCLKDIEKLVGSAGVDLTDGLARFSRRIEHLSKQGIKPEAATFDADFGRRQEYYTGFVFELTSPHLDDYAQVAGGGRYDTLLKILGADKNIPAVGCMIRLERLHQALAVQSSAPQKPTPPKKQGGAK